MACAKGNGSPSARIVAIAPAGRGQEVTHPNGFLRVFHVTAAGFGMIERFALVTDFGADGPYTGQMGLVLNAAAPGLPVISLVSDLPPFRPDLAAEACVDSSSHTQWR